MAWHLIGPSNLITHYFGMKTVQFESQEYTFSDEITYVTRTFLVCLQIKLNSQSCCFGLLKRKRGIPVRSRGWLDSLLTCWNRDILTWNKSELEEKYFIFTSGYTPAVNI